jgi:protein-S-isoprenylcysteine O-methyltransferase Ste14
MSEGNRPPNPDRPQENEQPLAKLLNDKQSLARPVREEEEAEATQAEAEQQERSRQVEGEQEEKSMADEQDNPGIRVPPPLIYLLPLILGLLLDRRWHVPFLPRGVARIIGWPLIGGGMALGGWFRRTMRDADAPVRTDKPVPRLTTDGPFDYSRNPGYLALAMIYAGIAVLRNSLWAILLLPAVLLVIQREAIGREERYLERTFGEEYLDYKASVRRWV